MSSCYLHILKTTSSEVHNLNIFKNRYTTHVPDFFFLICFITLFPVVQTCDKVFVYVLFIYEESRILAICFALWIFFLFFCLFWLETFTEDSFSASKKWNFFSVVLAILGFGPFLIVGRALKKKFRTKPDLDVPFRCHSFPIFHIKKHDMSLMRLYYLFNAVLKSIPQIYIFSALILGSHIEGFLVCLAQISLLVNMLIFSLAMAVTFPIRPCPRVYTESLCVIFNAFCKFMATFCSCAINILIFGMTFPKIGYNIFLVHGLRSILWMVPSWLVLKYRHNEVDGLCFAAYAFFLALIFNTIYIHPFEGRGKLIYYFFYLIKFFTELFFIFVFSDAHINGIFTYFALEVVTLGYLSCYGLVNILHKYKNDRCSCITNCQFEKAGEDAKNSTDVNSEKNIIVNVSHAGFPKPKDFKNDIKRDENTETTNKKHHKEKQEKLRHNDSEQI